MAQTLEQPAEAEQASKNGRSTWQQTGMPRRRPPLRQIGRQHLYLLAAFFALLGVVLVVTSLAHIGENWKGPAQGLGISFIAFGVTAIIFTAFTNALFEDWVADKIDHHVGPYQEALHTATGEILDSTRQQLAQVTGQFNDFVPLFSSCRTLGLENVYLTRSDALRDFSEYIKSELAKANMVDDADSINGTSQGRLWFVSSSMKGFIEAAAAEFDGRMLLEQAAKLADSNRLDLKILMTHPEHGDDRAAQEGRGEGDIPNEIYAALAILKILGVRREAVRFVPRTPTVFAIATTDVMLLNPYPYGTEAFRSFCITVRKTPSVDVSHARSRDIYEQYEHFHFKAPWAHGQEINPPGWDSPGTLP